MRLNITGRLLDGRDGRTPRAVLWRAGGDVLRDRLARPVPDGDLGRGPEGRKDPSICIVEPCALDVSRIWQVRSAVAGDVPAPAEVATVS